jgi:kynurenine formamidase
VSNDSGRETRTSDRWKRRPDGSTWGDFGADDQLGRLNLVDRTKVLQGVSEVREGRAFCLSLPLTLPGGSGLSPRRRRPTVRPVDRGEFSGMNYPLSRDDPRYLDVVSDDIAEIWLQYSTQWDALSHVGREFDIEGNGNPLLVYYNGYLAGTDILDPEAADLSDDDDLMFAGGARKLGIEKMAEAAVQGRAVMIDIEAHFGSERRLVSYQDLARIMDSDRIVVEPGDFVCLHTGFGRMLLDSRGNASAEMLSSCAALDGRDQELQDWISESGLVALISDNFAVEGLPARQDVAERFTMLPLHEHCLFRLGVYLGELWYLTELAQALRALQRSRFLLTAPPLRLPGAVGSPVSPVGTI